MLFDVVYIDTTIIERLSTVETQAVLAIIYS